MKLRTSSRIVVSVRRGCVSLCALGLILNVPAPAQSSASLTTRKLPFNGQTIVDSTGNAWIAGVTSGGLAVTPGAPQTQPGGGTCFGGARFPGPLPGPCTDAFVAKADRNGNTVFATYLGGSTDDRATALAVDTDGSVYVTGSTLGSFPTTPGSAIPSTATPHAFLAKFSADGTRILYSTYLPDILRAPAAIAVDSQGDAYVAGITTDAHTVVTKLNPDGSAYLYAAKIAGSKLESISAILLDAAGDVFLAGQTSSPDFPVTTGALQGKLAGAQNAFLAKLDPYGYILFATYLGGSGTDTASALATDSAGNIWVAGATNSMDFPLTAGAFQSTPLVPLWGYAPGGFVAKLSPDGHSLTYSSYLMSQGIQSLAVGASGDVYLAGTTGAGFAVTATAPQPCLAGVNDLYVTHLSSAGVLLDSTYVGTPELDGNSWLGSLTVTGGLVSFPAVLGNTGGGQPSIVQLRFGPANASPPTCLSPDVLNAATFFGGKAIAPGELVSLTGFGIGPDTGVTYQPGAQGEAPLSLGGVQVLFDGQPAPLVYVQSRQINVVAPVELGGRTSTSIRVQYNNATLGPVSVPVSFASPGLFRFRPGASTQAAALNQDGTVNGPDNPAARGSVITFFGTGFGLTDPACATGQLNFYGPSYLRSDLVNQMTISGGASLPVQYAGGAPTLLCGIAQINMIVPDQPLSGSLTAVLVIPNVALIGTDVASSIVVSTIAIK